jgi:hypothetical protein
MNNRLLLRSTRQTVLTICCWLALLGNGRLALSDDAGNVEPYIIEPTCVVIKVDTSRLFLPESLDQLAAIFPGAPRDVAAIAEKWIAALRSAADGQPIYATIGIPYSNRDLPAYLFLKATPQVDSQALIKCLGGVGKLGACVHDGMEVVMPQQEVDVASHLARLTSSPREGLSQAFAAVADYPVQVLLLPPDFVRRTIVELQPTLPPLLGGGPSSVLSEGIVWGAVGMDPGKSRAEVVFQSTSGQAAQQLSDELPKLVKAVYQVLPEVQQRIPYEALTGLSGLVTSAVKEDRLVIRFADREAAGGGLQFLAGMIATLQARATRDTNMNKFKQILIAMHNYHDTYTMFPPRDEVRDKVGKSGLSWRVHILPFVEGQKLYEQFHLDEPWDSPYNKPLIEKMPKVYQDGQAGTATGHTTFQTPVGEDTAFGGPKAVRFSHIIDGTSNTIALVQVKPELAVPWTAPEDYVFDPQDPGKGLQIDGDGRFLAAMLDGSIHRLRGDMSREMTLRLFRKSDREPIDWDEVR